MKAAKENTTQSHRILRMPSVLEKVQLSRASVYSLMSGGSFPKQIKLGQRASGWLEAEVDQWIEQRISSRGDL